MSKFSLDKEMNIEVKATFIAKGNDAPVSGEQYRLRLYDTDIFGEDYLGESKLNETGEGCIVLTHKEFSSRFRKGTLPDFYFVLYNNKIPVFQSKIMENVNAESLEQYTRGEGEVIDLGTYLVEIS